MNVHFYWYGDNFQFMNRLTILSHVNIGHNVIMWLAGNEPKSPYWISDIKEINEDLLYRLGEQAPITSECDAVSKSQISARCRSDSGQYRTSGKWSTT